MTQFRKLIAAAAVATSTLAAVPAQADTIQLGFILDSSGSIGSGNWNIIRTGLSNAINSLIPIGGANTYEVSVVSFSSSATIVANSVVVDSVATRTALAATIAAMPFLGSTTDFADAFSAMQTALTDNVGTAGFIKAGANTTSYVNFATDGVPDSESAGQAARNALIAAGVDNLSIEGIGSGVNAASLQTNYCYPQACDATSPYDFPNKGFYIAVDSATEYAAAIQNKIRIVTGQVPEPGTIALLGLGLLGLGALRRRS